MPERQVPIFIGMPVFRGEAFVEDSLRSILDQEFADFRLLISVDGGDQRSADVCARHAADPRIELVVQEKQLGWAANLNWLMSRSTGEFFCYWQQDDLCATSYLRVLHEYASPHPEAACVYSDIQWFGRQIHRNELASLVGPPVERVLKCLESPNTAPFRGLIRSTALLGAGPLRINAYDSRLEDFVWVAKLAREGELHRVAETLYFKRAHASNTHSYTPASESVQRGAWIEYGVGMLEAGLPLLPTAGRAPFWNAVAERLFVQRPDRWSAYELSDPQQLIAFASDFHEAVLSRFGDTWEGMPKLPDPEAVLQLLCFRGSASQADAPEKLVCEVAIRELHFRDFLEQASMRGRVDMQFGCGRQGNAILGAGWSVPEDWGVWSNGRSAVLRLPIPDGGGEWRVALHGSGFVHGLAAGESRGIVVRVGGGVIADWKCAPEAPAVCATFVVAAAGASDGVALELDFPNAVSPAELGGNDDNRLLGLALERVAFERCG
jgi:GT2 family glycosyltransferase